MSITAILIIVVFFAMVALMVFQKIPTLVALPIMGILLAIVGGVPFKALPDMVEGGVTLLYAAYVPIIIASIFGDIIKKTGITENIIRRAVELAGDNSLIVALVCLAVTTVCFIGLYGTGATVTVGLIILPILISVGVPKVVAGGILLFGGFLGYAFNPARWAFYVSLFKIGNANSLVSINFVASFAWKFLIPAAIIAVAFVVFGVLKKPRYLTWAAEMPAKSTDYKKVPLISLLSPIVPVVLLLVLKLSSISIVFLIGIAYAVITTQYKNKFKGSWQLITSGAYDGFTAIGLSVILMFGVGILVKAAQRPELSGAMGQIIKLITPTSVLGFILLFGLIGPLLTQYRGPMNPWGMGAALVSIFATGGVIGVPVLLAAFMTYDYVTGVSDATSSQVVWTAGMVDSSPVKLQLGSLPFTWLTSLIGVIMGVILFGVFA